MSYKEVSESINNLKSHLVIPFSSEHKSHLGIQRKERRG